MIGSDTYALERMPPVPHSDFSSTHDGGMLHQELWAWLGWPLASCGSSMRWPQRAARMGTCLFVSSPLNVTGGVSTPANAIAIR